MLSETHAPDRFTIDTKALGGMVPGAKDNKEGIIEDGEKSFRLLGKVDIWYIHAPSTDANIRSSLEGIQFMYKKGFFKRFGLSNFTSAQTQMAYDYMKEKDYVLPTAYQGNYNAVARENEEQLFPTLRKLGMVSIRDEITHCTANVLSRSMHTVL